MASTEIRHAAGTETALPLLRNDNSYDRVLQVLTDMGNNAINHFKTGVVYPTKMRSGLFTTGSLDNIDHNPSSNTAVGSFHGAITLTGHVTFNIRDFSFKGQKNE